MKKVFIIDGKEVTEKEFKKFCSQLKFSEKFNEAFLINGESEKKDHGSARFVQATNKKGKKYEYSTTSWSEEDIFEIKPLN